MIKHHQPQSVINRNGSKEKFDGAKIQNRLESLAAMKIQVDDATIIPIDTTQVSIPELFLAVCKGVHEGIKTSSLDILAAEECAKYVSDHPDFDRMAARILISNIQKEVIPDVRTYAEILYRHKDKMGRHFPRLSELAYVFYCKHADKLNAMLVHDRDYYYDYFGIETEIKQYLLKVIDTDSDSTTNFPTKVSERPQQLHLRVAIQAELPLEYLNGTMLVGDIPDCVFARIKEAYDEISKFVFTHATPTRLNSCAVRNQLVSCNLDAVPDDSKGIMDAATRAALLSRDAAGLGFSISDVRSMGSPIFGTGGVSEGIVNFIRIFGTVMVGFNQGGGKRKGSLALTLEVWHADIYTFLDLKLQQGDESARVRNLFYAVYACDEFMRRVDNDDVWYLMDPHDCPGLTTSWGDKFTDLYHSYISQKRYRRVVSARSLFTDICVRMLQTGQPYFTFKDTINRKSNQQGWATVKSLNLCCEVALAGGQINPLPFSGTTEIKDTYTIHEVANCNLASICVKKFLRVTPDGKSATYDFVQLAEIASMITRRLDNIIDRTRYPLEEARATNMRHRPIGIGIQGLQNLFYSLGLEWGSEEAAKLDEDIMEAIYYGALSESTRLAKEHGPYQTYARSPAAHGYLQPDLWLVEQEVKSGKIPDLPLAELLTNHASDMPPLWKSTSGRFDWDTLRAHIAKFGLRNSELTAPMPTASTSQIYGNFEAFEPATLNIYKRDTISGSFVVINKYMVNELIEMNLWNQDMLNILVASGGSVQNIDGLTASFKGRYKTAYEIKQKVLIDMAARRGKFVTMSQSLNVYFSNQPPETVGTMLMYAWKKGTKAIYYTRSQEGAKPQSFAISKEDEKNSFSALASSLSETNEDTNRSIGKSIKIPSWIQEKNNEEVCFLCSS